MSAFDLNDAETGGGGGLIPAGTIARAVFLIREEKTSRAGDPMLDVEWTITEGPFARRKVWDNMMLGGSEKAVAITKKTLRALVEGHYGIRPDDMSDAAKARRVVTLDQFSGMEGCIFIGVEEQEGYEPKNRVKFLLAPGEEKFLKPGQIAVAPAAPAAPAAPNYYGSTPAAPTYQAPEPAPAPAPAPAGNRPAWA